MGALNISRVHVALRADDLGVYKANRNGDMAYLHILNGLLEYAGWGCGDVR
jgi:hypothetical protein